MGEPARKLDDDYINPNIRPNLRNLEGGNNTTDDRTYPRLIDKPESSEPNSESYPGLRSFEGGGNTTDDRTYPRLLNNQESNPEELKTGSISDMEDDGSGVSNAQWANKTNKKKTLKKATGLKSLRKKGPLVFIITILTAGGIGFSAFFSPGMLLVHIKEVVGDKYNTQLVGMEARSTKILYSKINNTTKGHCGAVITVACKYSSMSDKQLKNFENAGIKVTSEKTTVTGRSKPTSFDFHGKTINAADFEKSMQDPNFRSAVKLAYNPKYGGMTDKIWSSVTKKMKIGKTATDLDGKTDEEKLKKIQDQTKNGTDSKKATATFPDDATDEEKAKAQKAADEANKVSAAADKVAKDGKKVGSGIIDEVGDAIKKSTSAISGGVGVLGAADSACTVYGTIQLVGNGAKTIRTVQLARYAMIFLNVADQIKAGTAKPEDVEYLGKILTTETAENVAKGKPRGKSATDSYGYKYAAYGDTGKTSLSASQFLAGGGLTGDLINISNNIEETIRKTTGQSPKKACKFIKNPFVSGASLVVGLGLMLIPGVNIAIGAKDVGQVAASIAYSLASATLIGLLTDIVAGTIVDSTTVGESSGDAFVSGVAGLLGPVAKGGGNSPLSPTQALEFSKLQTGVLAQYAEEDRIAHSPLDISNKNTFIGSIVSNLIPYTTKMSSLSGALNSVASLTTNSLSFATSQTTKAASVEDYEMCQDLDYRDPNGDGNTSDRIATDPYCNIIYGIPAAALDADPYEVIDALAGQIDDTTGEPKAGSEYAKFVTDCIDRDRPLGDSGENFDLDDGTKCMFSDKNSNYYVHYIDQRVDGGMEGMESSSAGSTATTTTPTTDATIDKAKLYEDSTSIPCAAGTTDAGTEVGYRNKVAVNIKLCTITSVTETNGRTEEKAIRVNSRVSGAWLALINAANAAKVISSPFHALDSFRTNDEQTFEFVNAGSPTDGSVAEPGTSNHQMGLAVDIDLPSIDGGLGKKYYLNPGQDALYDWLTANAGTYGITQLLAVGDKVPETWHWQVVSE